MSVSPSMPPGGPSLAQVLLQRTFARPPEPFVDGDLMKAFRQVSDKPEAPRAAAGAPGRVDLRA